MKILVTGGAGFIGSHIVEHYQESGAEIRVLDNLRTGYRHNLDGLRHHFIEGSVTDRALVRQAVDGVDYVFHLAAMVSVPESMANPGECVDINVHGLLNVLEEAAAAGVRKLVFASSAAVYGDNPTVPKTETMLPEPKSPYAITKLDGEHYLGLFQREGLLETAALRFFNVFGPRQDPNSAYAAAVPIFIRKALAGEPITAKLTRAPGNNEPIGGLKVVTANGWFAARPSGTENLYKVYAESFRDEQHLEAIVSEAQSIVLRALNSAGKLGAA